jgi:hypothetical protein
LTVILFIGYLSTRIGQAKKKYNPAVDPWFEANAFITIVILVYIPATLWFCFFGWKVQANKEKNVVREMMYKELEQVQSRKAKDCELERLKSELKHIKKKNYKKCSSEEETSDE